MKKILILTLALWVGISNFAYASAKIECLSMMAPPVQDAASQPEIAASASHHACHTGSCQCAITAPSTERTSPAGTQAEVDQFQAISSLDMFKALPPAYSRLGNNFFGSPPKQPPLYKLFSVYRI